MHYYPLLRTLLPYFMVLNAHIIIIICYIDTIRTFVFCCLAPFEINITPQNMQQVGGPLTLDCSIKEINVTYSSLEIVWITNTTILQRTNITSNGSSVYTDSYTITQLTTSDQGRVIQCMANRATPPVVDNGIIILDVIGM